MRYSEEIAAIKAEPEVWFSAQIAALPAHARSTRYGGYLIKGTAFYYEANGQPSLAYPDAAVRIENLDELPEGCLAALLRNVR